MGKLMEGNFGEDQFGLGGIHGKNAILVLWLS